MTRSVIHSVRIEFGDCDPAGIVWFPNFYRWLDHASRRFFSAHGVPRWAETMDLYGTNGTPLVDSKARFVNSATYGETIDFHVSVKEWRGKSFVQAYRVMRGDTLILECEEVRIFSAPREGGGIRAVEIPPAIRALCEGGS